MDLDKNLRGMDANTQSALEEERARCQKVQNTFFFDSFDHLSLKSDNTTFLVVN